MVTIVKNPGSMQDTLGDISHHENGLGLRARQWNTEANLHINTIQELLPSFASVLNSSWLPGGHNGPWMLEVKCWLYVDSRRMHHHLYSTTGRFDISGSSVSGSTGEGALILQPRGLSQHHFSALTSQCWFSATFCHHSHHLSWFFFNGCRAHLRADNCGPSSVSGSIGLTWCSYI